MITGAATAVSSIIGNFQMAGMNKTLDLIEQAPDTPGCRLDPARRASPR